VLALGLYLIASGSAGSVHSNARQFKVLLEPPSPLLSTRLLNDERVSCRLRRGC